MHCHTVGFSTRRVRRRHYESLKNQVFQNERERTLLSCAAGGRRTGTADLPSLRGVGADTEASRDARLRADAAERTERTECADGGRGGTLLLAAGPGAGAGAPSRGGGRGAAPLCAVCSGMREGRRRGVPPGPLAWRSSSSSASSGMGSGSMSRMLLCGSRLRSRLSPERARSRVSNCRTRARAPSNSMFFSSN